uniref:DNA translocase FtsK n=1 Tax=Thermus thermophilus TaxID=274 RepID=UPI00241FEEC2
EEEEEEAVDETPAPRASAEELRRKIEKLPVRMAAASTEVVRDEDIPREENFEGYKFPTLDQLEDPEGDYSASMETTVREQAGILEEALRTFQIDAEVAGIESGPVVTLYAILLAPGTRVARLNAISSDIARALQAQNIRIIPNMAGKSTVGIEVPNTKKEKVRLKELMSSGRSREMMLPMFLGKDSAGDPLVADLAKMPHMLIAGTTGSGKSVCMNTIIMSWLYTKRPDELKLCLVDPKMVEMSQFSDIPHLMCPVITEMGKAAAILEWAVGKMEERYELLREAGVRDIRGYNDLTEEELREAFEPSNDVEWAKLPKKLPYMVFVIDELADLMMTNKEVEHSIVRIAQKARAVGMHLILATQRPSVDILTSLIKVNIPARLAFAVSSGFDSRTILDAQGAERLIGQGDALFHQPGLPKPVRLQVPYVSEEEVARVAGFLRGQSYEDRFAEAYGADFEPPKAVEGGGPGEVDFSDPLLKKAAEIVVEEGYGSVSRLQRRLSIGHARAGKLMDALEAMGIVGPPRGSKPREVLVTKDQLKDFFG